MPALQLQKRIDSMVVLDRMPSLDMGARVAVPCDVQQHLPRKKGGPVLDTRADLVRATSMLRSKGLAL